MRKFYSLLMIAVCSAQPITAIGHESLVECRVSGHAGCSDICVGSGVRNDSIWLTINPDSRLIELNGLKGHISDSRPIDASEEHLIDWQWQVIGLDHLRYRSVNGRKIVTLTNHESELEFSCN
ncbi:hypothetical protein [Novosphingobium naphthalenivorans]|uniref:hypothetical protein n=1 Tax=Novosphingobium naphthalenivorans TaxID=273168 RepID=UPI0012ED35BC|nr:hypothetical protein [Novosphingobium naphthalenivorans]